MPETLLGVVATAESKKNIESSNRAGECGVPESSTINTGLPQSASVIQLVECSTDNRVVIGPSPIVRTRERISVEPGARLDNEQANWVANPTKTMVVNTAQDLIRCGGRETSAENENY